MFGDPAAIKLAQEGAKKAAHEDCRKCSGTMLEKVKCEECSGTGKVICEYCGGDGGGTAKCIEPDPVVV